MSPSSKPHRCRKPPNCKPTCGAPESSPGRGSSTTASPPPGHCRNAYNGTATVGSDGTATLQWRPATGGQRTVTAEYSGAGTVNASSDRASVVVTGGTSGGTGSFAGLGFLGSLSAGK
ncbi:Ig-like domain repeat protein [Nocardia stercoris]|uniref:Ig-like domain repeat protein n=1 Tax=Nocardia stercoris TaxID=2483361 RepID=A0A3M2L3Y9_9NOCA|nr:Ig-like domain repeat protein [Nocardia stercoris]